MVKLYMFRASLAHHWEFRNCVCSQVSYSIILDSVFCLLRAVTGQPSHTIPGPTKPCTDTARNKRKAESRIIEYDTWLQTLPDLLMMSEWRSKHVEHYHQIKSIKAETLCLKENAVAKLNSTEMDFWRRSARISRKDKIRNTNIKQKMDVTRSLVDDVKTKQLHWYGDVSRMEEGRLPKTLWNGVHQEEENEVDLNVPGRTGLEDWWGKRDLWKTTGMTEATGGRRYYNCQWAQKDVETFYRLLNNKKKKWARYDKKCILFFT